MVEVLARSSNRMSYTRGQKLEAAGTEPPSFQIFTFIYIVLYFLECFTALRPQVWWEFFSPGLSMLTTPA